jgi:Putative serine esterase (DUF676)
MLYLKDRIESAAGIAHRPDGGVVVRGYCGNICKTERGIRWLGKRMARWLLHETLWLDQLGLFAPDAPPYSRISFIGHSLGGVVQNYAIAMIELITNGEFFRKLRPVHLITLASPWLGVSAENPAYVKLALDVGLIGRTGQDLGLMNRLGQKIEAQPDQKAIRDSRPILRLLALPNSPAHRVIRRFCSRTIYANVVNDGIVPLRTSAMFFLDWNSFETVEKSIPPNGLIMQLGNLPGIVGLPTLDGLIGGVERMFSPRRSEEAEDEGEGKSVGSEESGVSSRGQSLFPAFLRRRTTMALAPGVVKVRNGEKERRNSTITPASEEDRESIKSAGRDRRNSMPSMTATTPDLKTDFERAKEGDLDENAGGQNVTAVKDSEGEGLKRGVESWNERRGDHPDSDEIAKSLTDESSMEKQSTTNSSTGSDEVVQPPAPIPHRSPRAPQPGRHVPTLDINAALMNDDDDTSEQTPNPILSSKLVESPTRTSQQLHPSEPESSSHSDPNHPTNVTGPPQKEQEQPQGDSTSNPLLALFQHFRPGAGRQSITARRFSKVYSRSQTVSKSPSDVRPPPPRTTFFESFPSLLNPPLPDAQFITDPTSRPKTIFHDRIYTPDDIPPVSTASSESSAGSDEQSSKREKLRLEEKIARDWHSDMTWRKVLVKLEPDAHNNIIVRRMFPNAYGWPVVEHLVREHFVHDPEGIHREFTQESGVIPLDSPVDEEGRLGAMSPSWEGTMSESDESDEEEGEERPGSMGRAKMSDEDEGEVLEMTDFSAQDMARSQSEGKTRTKGEGGVHKGNL